MPNRLPLKPAAPGRSTATLTGLRPAQVDTEGPQTLEVKGTLLGQAMFHLVRTGRSPHVVPLKRLRGGTARGWAQLSVPSLPAGEYHLVAEVAGQRVVSAQTVQAWSPRELAGLPNFSFYRAEASHTHLLAGRDADVHPWWEPLAADMPADWRGRDGAVLVWLANEHGARWLMAGGWSGYPPPFGWGDQLTTNEVWSSPDGVHYTQLLPDGHPQWLRRHTPAYGVHAGSLVILGGDHLLPTAYPRDVIATRDGLHWETLCEQTPWSPRMLAMAVSYHGALWFGFGHNGLRPEETPASARFHNDVWCSADGGRQWRLVVGDRPEAPDVPSGRGLVNQWVVFEDRVYMVAGGRYELPPHGENALKTFYKEVWSTQDFVSWRREADLPNLGDDPHHDAGFVYNAVEVHDGLVLNYGGYNYAGNNLNRTWFSGQPGAGALGSEGEWREAPNSDDTVRPQEGSHAHGFASNGEFLLMVSGNHTVREPKAGEVQVDPQLRRPWRLSILRGHGVRGVPDEGPAGVQLVGAQPQQGPWLVPGLFGGGQRPGWLFPGLSDAVLAAARPQAATQGLSVFWLGRFPEQPKPASFHAPSETVLGWKDGGSLLSVGLENGQLCTAHWEGPHPDRPGNPFVKRLAGSGLSDNTGQLALCGVVFDPALASVQFHLNGALLGEPQPADWPAGGIQWQHLGIGYDGRPLRGGLSWLLVVDGVLTPQDLARLNAWALQREPGLGA